MTLAEISERQKISLSYLEQLFGKLRRHGLVTACAGPAAATTWRKDIGQVSVADIILAVDEPIDATQCGGKENCHDEQKCITHDLWADLNEHIFDYLRSVTLRELVDEADEEVQRRCGHADARQRARTPRSRRNRRRPED